MNDLKCEVIGSDGRDESIDGDEKSLDGTDRELFTYLHDLLKGEL
jgi:hypothetical protein